MMNQDEWQLVIADLATLYTGVIMACGLLGFAISKMIKWVSGRF